MPSFFVCQIRMLKSVLSTLTLRFLKKAIAFWFHSLSSFLRPHMFFISHVTKTFLIDPNISMPGDSFMKMIRLLSTSKVFKQAPIMSTWSMINPNKQDIAINIYNDFFLTVGENVSLKSTPRICKKPCATNLVLY